MAAPKLEIRHLQMIHALWRAGRVNDAADMLGLTASALSHRTREAERRLGVPLFERMHKKLRLTAAAEYLAEVSDRILLELEMVEDEIRRMNEEVDHVVRLAIETYDAYAWLPAFLEALAARAPRISVRIVSVPAAEISSALLARRIDLALAFTPLAAPGLEEKPLFEDKLAFVCGRRHRLADRERVLGEDIEGERFITYSKVPAPDQEFAEIFRSERRYPRWAETAEAPAAILSLVAAGQGASILSDWAVRQASADVVIIPLGAAPIRLGWKVRSRVKEPVESPSGRVARVLSDYFAAAAP